MPCLSLELPAKQEGEDVPPAQALPSPAAFSLPLVLSLSRAWFLNHTDDLWTEILVQFASVRRAREASLPCSDPPDFPREDLAPSFRRNPKYLF